MTDCTFFFSGTFFLLNIPEPNTGDWSLDSFGNKEMPKEPKQVVRRFINSAIYVEKPLSTNISSENCSVSCTYTDEELLDIQTANTKRCACSVDQKTCPCHANSNLPAIVSDAKKEVNHKIEKVKTRVSLASSSSMSTHPDKNVLIQNWIAKKEEEKRKIELKEKLLREAKIKEREAVLEQSRNNFKKWLMNKKRIEMEAKKKKQKEIEEQQLRELEKEKRQCENALNFQLWLKKKEEEQIEKKIQQQLQMITELERKEKQLKENERAFNEWLKNSKDKQKPVPLNRGLQSLCSSSSIAYKNPNPWNPAP